MIWMGGEITTYPSPSQEEEVIDNHLHPDFGEVWIPTNITTTFSLPTAAGADAFGAWIQLVAATTASRFTDFHRFIVVLASIDGSYEIQIGTGPNPLEVEITRARFHWFIAAPVRAPPGPLEILCPRIPGGTRVVARAKCSVAGPQTIDLQFGYHEYPPGV